VKNLTQLQKGKNKKWKRRKGKTPVGDMGGDAHAPLPPEKRIQMSSGKVSSRKERNAVELEGKKTHQLEGNDGSSESTP